MGEVRERERGGRWEGEGGDRDSDTEGEKDLESSKKGGKGGPNGLGSWPSVSNQNSIRRRIVPSEGTVVASKRSLCANRRMRISVAQIV